MLIDWVQGIIDAIKNNPTLFWESLGVSGETSWGESNL